MQIAEQNSRTVAQVLGEITWLLSQTASYKHLTLADLEWAVMPAILLNQFHIFYKEKQPIAVALWARLSEEHENTLTAQVAQSGTARLEVSAWRSGDRLWLMDMVSPFATRDNKLYDQLIIEMAKGFKGAPFRHLKRNPENYAQELAEMDVKEMGCA